MINQKSIDKFLLFSLIIIVLAMGTGLFMLISNNDLNIDSNFKMINKLKEQRDIEKYTDAEKFKLFLQDVKEIKNLSIVEKDNFVSEINITIDNFIENKETVYIFSIVKTLYDSFEIENKIILNISNRNSKKVFELKNDINIY